MSSVNILSVQVEHHESGFGLDAPSPRISWRFAPASSSAADWSQTAYELCVTRSGETKTYEVQSDENVLVPWPGQPLKSREKARVEVRAKGSDGQWTDKKGIDIEAGLLDRGDWEAKVAGGPKIGAERGPLRPVRVWGKFEWDGQGSSARLYATSYGMYTAYLNGQRIGDHVLSPGWTSYKHNHRYQVYDVASLLVKGTNVLSAEVGEGWWAARLGRPAVGCLFGDRLGFLGQVEVDGKVIGASGKDWKWSKFEVELGQIYDGEVVDTRLADPEWWRRSDELAEGPVEILDFPKGVLQISDAPPVRRVQEIKAIETITTPSGKRVFDFGQNLVGWIRLDTDVQGDGNGELLIRHAEVMERGELGTRPLRTAKAEMRIKLGGKTKGFEPRFTWFGFRYAEITGADVSASDITAIVITSQLERTGHFSCSHEMVNQLHRNVVWSMLGNFVSLPTDCPQRDERLGWTGDIQVFANTANYLFDTAGFLEGWMRDVAAETKEYDGICPEVVPWIYAPYQPGRNLRAMGIWADCTALTPWDLYSFFGDKEILRRSFECMCSWLDKGVPRGKNGLYTHGQAQFGDWLDPRAPPQYPAHGQTDVFLTCDAFLVYTTQVVARISAILGESDAHQRYSADHARLLDVFQKEYITPSGRMMSDTQTALACALKFDLFPPDLKARAVERLDFNVRWDAFRISTGFAGTPIVLPALAENGLLHLAYRMLQEGENPSWLYPVSMGATTIWERWDSMLPDGSINPGQMTSFNHYALGAVAHFLHTTVGGLSPNLSILSSAEGSAPVGWKRAIIRPQPGGTISHAKTSHLSPYGLFRSEWAIKDGKFKLEVEVPPNAEALVVLPSGKEVPVGSGTRTFECDWKEDPRWPPKLIPSPGSMQPKDVFLP